MFSVGRGKYKMGSKMFPVARKSQMKSFDGENTIQLDAPEFAQALNKLTFESGRCYSNSQTVFDIGQSLGLDIQYYAGWLFVSKVQMPVHHAWCVVNGNSVIDASISLREIVLLRGLDYTDPNWREKVVPVMKEYKRKPLPTTNDCVFGHVPEGFWYVGSPDTRDNAVRLFWAMRDQFPNHPSYKTMHIDGQGASTLQRMLSE